MVLPLRSKPSRTTKAPRATVSEGFSAWGGGVDSVIDDCGAAAAAAAGLPRAETADAAVARSLIEAILAEATNQFALRM